jgi:hypothetical protein
MQGMMRRRSLRHYLPEEVALPKCTIASPAAWAGGKDDNYVNVGNHIPANFNYR